MDQVSVEELAIAVQSGDTARVQLLLHTNPALVGMDMNANDEHRALHYAVLQRDAAMVRLLMEAGADARKGIYPHRDATSAWALARDREYNEILFVLEEEERRRREELSCPNATISPVQDQINAAIRNGENDTAIRLLNADRSLIHACDREGATPLHIAAEEANHEMLVWLLHRRANVLKRDVNGLTALDRAAYAADPRNENAQAFPLIAEPLLAHGAELTLAAAIALPDIARVRECIAADPASLRNIGPRDGLLTLAVNHGHLEIVRLLLDLGVDVDERVMLQELQEPTLSWGKPLWCAALANRREIAELLLDRGADPNANVYASGWPLRNAWNHKDGSIKKLLLARGARPQPYMVSEAHDVAEARRLLEFDPGEGLAQELAWSAADHGCPAIVELALQHLAWPGTDPRWHWLLIQPIRGATSDHSDKEGHFKSMAAFLQRGVDPNVSRYGQTALHFAAGYHGTVQDADRASFAAMLLDAGARLDARDDLLQSTPLAWACRWGRLDLAKLLIARGAPMDEPDAEPWATPKAWATKMNQNAVLVLLEER